MARPAVSNVDPSKIFEQGDCFYQGLFILCNVNPENTQLAVTLGEPVMVVGALTIELFLKCLICIETGKVPRGHDLKALFNQLSPSIRNRIQNSWDTGIVVRRAKEWDELENILAGLWPIFGARKRPFRRHFRCFREFSYGSGRAQDLSNIPVHPVFAGISCICPFENWPKSSLGVTMARDLPSALAVASRAFERIRYSYEGGTQDLQYYLQDLPALLGRVILEMKPEWQTLQRTPQQLSPPSRH